MPVQFQVRTWRQNAKGHGGKESGNNKSPQLICLENSPEKFEWEKQNGTKVKQSTCLAGF